MSAALLKRWTQFGYFQKMILTCILFWIIGSNLFMTIMLVRPSTPVLHKKQITQLLQSSSVLPLEYDAVRKLMNNLNYAALAYMPNNLPYRPRGSETICYAPADEVGGLIFLKGHGRIVNHKLLNNHRKFYIESLGKTTVRIETYLYPNWIARCDGQKINARGEAGSGLIILDLPAGNHTITLDYKSTNRSDKLANIISMSALLFILALFFF